MEEDKLKRANELSELIKDNEKSIDLIKHWVKEKQPLRNVHLGFGGENTGIARIILRLPNLEKSLPLILINSEEELTRLKKEFQEL